MMRAEPAALRAASASARRLAEELPRLTDQVTATAHAAAADCPGFATAAALTEVARSWQARLAAVSASFARAADGLGATADRDTAADRHVAGTVHAPGH
jgi:hypothetical protein